MPLGDNIRFFREKLGLSQEELARRMGYKDRSTIAKIENNINDLTQSKIVAIAKILETTPGTLMGWEDQQVNASVDPTPVPTGFSPMPMTKTVPRVGRIACGQPITAEENVEGYDSTLDSWHADFTLLCVGDSMAPKILDGDVVAIRCQQTVDNGEVAAVRVGNEATLKQVFHRGHYLELRPINPNYESLMFFEEEMNEVHIEGKAVGLCRGL